MNPSKRRDIVAGKHDIVPGPEVDSTLRYFQNRAQLKL